MKRFILRTSLISIVLIFVDFNSNACTTFCIKDAKNLVVGKNFDFFTGIGHVIVNKRNVWKTSFTPPGERSFEWVSKYGSVTFNQMGLEFPCGGINEKGLVIELLWLSDTKYPELDERIGMFESQWIQYQLDNFATVQEVIESDAMVRISKSGSAPIHLFICDSGGHTATFEYIEGKMISRTGAALPICALANDSYDKSNGFINSVVDLKLSMQHSSETGSLDRFGRTALMLREFSTQNPVEYAFNILNVVSQGDFTQWSIVYDIKNMSVYFKTNNNAKKRIIRLVDLDFSCNVVSLYCDIDDRMILDNVNFRPYSYDKNRETIFKAIGALSKLPELKPFLPSEQDMESMAHYPSSSRCTRN